MGEIDWQKIHDLISREIYVNLRQQQRQFNQLEDTREDLAEAQFEENCMSVRNAADNVNVAKTEQDKFLESAARHDFHGGGVTNIPDNECMFANVDEEEFDSLLEANLEPGQTVQSVIRKV